MYRLYKKLRIIVVSTKLENRLSLYISISLVYKTKSFLVQLFLRTTRFLQQGLKASLKFE